MNNFFPVLLAVLVPVIALLWWFSRRADQHQRLAIATLTDQLKDPELSEEQRQNLQQRLAEAMLAASHSDSRIWWLPALVIALGGLYLYQKLGTPEATEHFVYAAGQPAAASQQTPAQTPPSMEAAVAALKQRIEQDPQNTENWLLYGRSMMALKNYPEAVRAYEKALQLQPDNSWVLASLAEAKAFAAGKGTFRGEPEELLKKALALDPDNQKALWLQGMNAFEQGQPDKAEKLWTHLLTLVDNPRVAEQLSAQINLARQQQGKPPLAASAPPKAAQETPAKPVNLPVTVDITEQQRASLKDRPAVLYVYAKPATGMPMPIAVVRANASQFPVTVTLNDANSLQPNRRLSQFEQVKVGARISFSGNAMPQPGDIESGEILVQPAKNTKPLSLLLNKTR